MTTVTPIAKDLGIKKNIFEQALDKAKAVISGERSDPTEQAKVEPATTQIKNNVKAEKPDAYVKPAQVTKAVGTVADTNTVKELWNNLDPKYQAINHVRKLVTNRKNQLK